MTGRDWGTRKDLLRRKNARVVFARRRQRRHLRGRRKNRGRSASHYGNAAAREGTIDGYRVHSRRTLDAAEGIDRFRSAAVTLVAPESGSANASLTCRH